MNPVRSTEQFKVTLGNPTWLTPDQSERLYAVLERWTEDCPTSHPHTKLLLACHPHELTIAIGTGLRKSNQYAMRWNQVDLKERRIHIPQTKNGRSLTLPITNKVYEALLTLCDINTQIAALQQRAGEQKRSCGCRWERRQQHTDSDGYVFPIQENREWWKKALCEAGITKFRWHDLRHTTASIMVQKKVPLFAVGAALGHSSISTIKRYAHLNLDSLSEAMSVLDEPR